LGGFILMTGTLINAAAIVLGGLLGLLFHRGIPENFNRTIQDGLGIVVVAIGIQYAVQAEHWAVLGISLALGAAVGEWQQWDRRLQLMGDKVQHALKAEGSGFVQGFVSASLLFCVGAMAIVGALEDGLTGNYDVLMVKALLDGIFAVVFSANLGAGVILSALPVLLYQGTISLAAVWLKPILTPLMMNTINSLGGLLIAALGLNIIGITRIRIANLLPALLLAPIIIGLMTMIPFGT
jgi:uncharacterized membrane protein YqgA involved in biofilm formation